MATLVTKQEITDNTCLLHIPLVKVLMIQHFKDGLLHQTDTCCLTVSHPQTDAFTTKTRYLYHQTCTTAERPEYSGVQPTSCMDNEPEHSRGIRVKDDQFGLDHTQNRSLGRWWDQMSLPCTQEVLRHLPTCNQPPGFVLHAYHPHPHHSNDYLHTYTNCD